MALSEHLAAQLISGGVLLVGLVAAVVPYYVARAEVATAAFGSTRSAMDVEPTHRAVLGMRAVGTLVAVGGAYFLAWGPAPAPRVTLALGVLLGAVGLGLVAVPRPVAAADARINGLGRSIGDAPGPDAEPTGMAVLAVRIVGAGVAFLGALALATVLAG